jgi:hypothetical protein
MISELVFRMVFKKEWRMKTKLRVFFGEKEIFCKKKFAKKISYFGKMIEGEEEQELEYFKGPEGVVNTSLKASEGKDIY